MTFHLLPLANAGAGVPGRSAALTALGSEGAPTRTVGVEEELLLVNPLTAWPAAVAEDVAEAAREAVSVPEAPGLSASADPAEECPLTLELQQEQIEVVGPPLLQLADLADAIRRGRALADAAAARVGARAAALATCPQPVHPHLVPKPRYRRIQDRFGLTAREQLVCGFHVHVSIVSAEEAVAVLDRIRIWLPLLLALSANSPFWNGTDSGYSSFRYQAWSRWPTSGAMEIFGSPAAYDRQVAALLACGVPVDEGMIYFDARLSRRFPTVEVRVADVCLDADHAAALAAVVRALVETASRQWRRGQGPQQVSAAELRAWSWQASRAGVEGQLVDPLTGRPCPAGDAVAELLDLIRPVLAEWNEETAVDAAVTGILRDGSGARRQLEAYGRRGDFADVVRTAVEATHAGTVPAPAGQVEGRRS